jgi:hypothetical protein
MSTPLPPTRPRGIEVPAIDQRDPSALLGRDLVKAQEHPDGRPRGKVVLAPEIVSRQEFAIELDANQLAQATHLVRVAQRLLRWRRRQLERLLHRADSE